MKITGVLVEIMVQLDLDKYGPCVVFEKEGGIHASIMSHLRNATSCTTMVQQVQGRSRVDRIQVQSIRPMCRRSDDKRQTTHYRFSRR